MTRIIALAEIEKALPSIDVIGDIEKGFVAFSEGKVTVPPVGELLFPKDNGELHIKYGAIDGDDVAVVKIATGFYDNPRRGLPPFGGMNIVFSARTGLPEAVLLDGGALTNIRTAAAGAVAAKHLGPKRVTTIGILGSGTQARLQAEYLKRVTDCRIIALWGRDKAKTEGCAKDLAALGFTVSIKAMPAEVAQAANLIVTTTASHRPLLTAMGSDTPEKSELDPAILKAARAIVADSIPQCLVRGEIHHALKAGAISEERIVELGAVIAGKAKGRQGEDDITIADLTGVAVQDIMIAKAVLARL
jgi:ornithine cyclodeaminase